MKKKPKVGDAVECKWIDAVSVDSWTPAEEVDEDSPALIRSVGILVRISKEDIVLALSQDENNNSFSSYLVVPSGMIESVRKLG